MSLIPAPAAEDLMQPGFADSDDAAGDPHSDAPFLPSPHAWSEDSKYCLKNYAVSYAVSNGAACDRGSAI